MKIHEIKNDKTIYIAMDDRLGNLSEPDTGEHLLASLRELFETDWRNDDVVLKCGGDIMKDESDYDIRELVGWKAACGYLHDSDGNKPDEVDYPKLMREFRDSHCITGYWFCDFSRINQENEELAWDSWNNKWNESSECGPSIYEIDFTGLE